MTSFNFEGNFSSEVPTLQNFPNSSSIDGSWWVDLGKTQEKISKNFPPTQFLKTRFTGFFLDIWLIFRHGSNGTFWSLRTNELPRSTFGRFGRLRFWRFSTWITLTETNNFQVFENCVGGKFFENFSWVSPRSTHQGASIELSFVWFYSVGASEKKCHSKKNSSGANLMKNGKCLPDLWFQQKQLGLLLENKGRRSRLWGISLDVQ